MNKPSLPFRIMSVALTSRGFGHAVLEGGNSLIAHGNRGIRRDKNANSLAQIEKLMDRYAPEALILDDLDAKGTRRAARIKELHRRAVALAKARKLKMAEISARELRSALLGNEDGTKHEMAESLAKRFPDELNSRLPPKRKPWKSEDVRMDIFDAVGLAVASRMSRKCIPQYNVPHKGKALNSPR